MRTYPEYKDSGVEWIGEIPKGWEVERLKYFSEVVLSSVDRHIIEEELGVSICHYPDVYNNEVINKTTVLPSGTCTEFEFEKFHLRIGNILLTKDSESPDDIGVPTFVEEELENTVCGYHLSQITPIRNNIFPKFLYRYIQSDFVSSYFETEANGITRYGLGKPSIENLSVPLPPHSEQKQISDYLDRKTQQIDDLIEKTERKIELLKEQRSSLINHSVTKGLDPNVEMKDSGVEWIGEIPKGWNTKRIKHLSQVKRGSSPRPIDDPKYFDDENGEYSWVRISDVSASEKYLEKTTQKLSELGSSLSTKMTPGDIFLSIAGTVGKPIITKIKCCIHDGFVWFENLNYEKELLYQIFLTGVCFQGLGKMGTQLNLNTDTVGGISIPIPPPSEQKQISEHLDQETGKIDQTVDTETKRIDLLKEYRQSLISNVVTGKIDVRDEVVQ